ncbi:ShlB/FhaC/HecB family hemolysin secretion/activation protein [Sphingomonas aliaeris]|uniref:ShlB/FhaC/HecB family hemolysin secretion/activation protein n=1 Tax=Sphingomonas aliaeris TaxID=2759526 RepID=UPI001CED44EB|nr:ShlB/FhaC/HecB family hemolysin secretion/activation protein [Sphingomonas aliaeris]
MRWLGKMVWTASALMMASASYAQTGLNQADPSIVIRSLPKPGAPVTQIQPPVVTDPAVDLAPLAAARPRVASAIIVVGGDEIPRGVFAAALVPFLGANLGNGDLSRLAGSVAAAARDAGYPFARAWIEPQSMAQGVLRVSLEAGTLSAVRVIGAHNPLADRMLTRALVTGRAVRRAQLERAILLIGDIPGLSVKESRYIRQDGFGILLVTIAEDRASLYAQIDNRGSKEVGPLRTTLLGSLRSVLRSGDELGVVSAQTPFQPSEFFFLRARYSTPVNADGAVVSISGSYGRAHPGGTLLPLRVIGKSYDGSLSYTVPLLRDRRRSIWASLDLRSLQGRQTLLDSPLRNDRLTTLSGALNGNGRLGGGVLRGSVTIVAGLPLPGMTHEGDRRISRSDGDARFVTLNYDLEWATRLSERLSVALTSQAQIASRPLLATTEIGVGGRCSDADTIMRNAPETRASWVGRSYAQTSAGSRPAWWIARKFTAPSTEGMSATFATAPGAARSCPRPRAYGSAAGGSTGCWRSHCRSTAIASTRKIAARASPSACRGYSDATQGFPGRVSGRALFVLGDPVCDSASWILFVVRKRGIGAGTRDLARPVRGVRSPAQRQGRHRRDGRA